MMTLFDPMDSSECAMTGNGLRVAPVLGGRLQPGEDGAYVIPLRCYRNGNNTLSTRPPTLRSLAKVIQLYF